MEERVTITVERYNQLIRAEQDANQLKMLISEKHEKYDTLDWAEMQLLYKIYVGKKEDNKV